MDLEPMDERPPRVLPTLVLWGVGAIVALTLISWVIGAVIAAMRMVIIVALAAVVIWAIVASRRSR